MSVIYKTLFEVKLMHEYYLTTKEGSTIFEEPSQTHRLAFLTEFIENRLSVNEDIGYEFPQSLKTLYEGLHLKLIPSYSGFRVVGRVRPVTLADGSVVYRPFIPFPSGLSIFISLERKNYDLDTYTNQRIKRSFPSTYFFSTQDVVSARKFPFLTSAIPAEDNTAAYEQGELALSSTNTIREFYRSGGADEWNDVKGAGFANESDRVLLPSGFEYRFDNSIGLTEAEFIVKDSNGTELARIPATDSNGLGPKYFLDLSGKIKSIPLSLAFQPLSFLYSLEVTGNNGLHVKHKVLFSDELLQSNPWGLVHIDTTASNDFTLFAPDGFLISRKDPLGVIAPAPVFEIPVKSRFAYWRFINDKGKELNISALLTDYVNKEGNVLITKKPRSIAKHWFLLEKDPLPGTVYVPNPLSYDARIEQDRRLFFNITVPQSALFPITI